MTTPRKMSKRQDLICWLSVYADATTSEQSMPLPNAATIAKYRQKWQDTAVALAKLEMQVYRKRLGKPPI